MASSEVVTEGFTARVSSYPAYKTEIYTNLGPLTTIFTPPARCTSEPQNLGLVEFSITSGAEVVSSFDCGQGNLHYIQSPECYPSSSGVAVLQTDTSIYAGYWSPGVVCPSGWFTGTAWTYPPGAVSSLPVNLGDLIGNHNMAATEVKCCPSGFKFNDEGRCAIDVTTTTTGAMCAITDCSQSGAGTGSVCLGNATAFSWNPTDTKTSIGITAYQVIMVHQDSDLSDIPSSTSSPTYAGPTDVHSTTGTGHKQGQSAPSATNAGAGRNKHSSSSPSAKVLAPAIVVPVVVVFALLAGVILLLRRRKKKARTSAYARSSQGVASSSAPEKDTIRSSVVSNDDPIYGRAELPSPRPENSNMRNFSD